MRRSLLEWAVLAFIIFVVLLLVGSIGWTCHQASLPVEGVIVDKGYRRAHSTITYIGSHPVSQFHPDRWYVVLENGKIVDVSESRWERMEVGGVIR